MLSDNSIESANTITCCYKEPKWSGMCTENTYGLDILKNGVINGNIKLSGKPYYIIGRYKTCDLVFDHPSLSRFHSVLQYCSGDNEEGKEKGWYLMDLDSTHGTLLNKKKIPSHTFIRIHTGHVLKFGGSTRLYIVTGPDDDKEPISPYTWTELMELKNSKAARVADAEGYLPTDESKTNSVCMWGMKDNIEEEDNNASGSKAEEKLKHEHLYRDDPVRIIKTYFEKEGFDEPPPYEFNKAGFSRSICRLELPVFGENGEKIISEVSGSEKKKELIARCALEACRILDEMDELFKTGGARNRPKKDNKYYSEKDYYSSEEDDFYDRTGQIEEKRIQRMRRFGVMSKEPELVDNQKSIDARNSDSVLLKFNRLEEINGEILSIEKQLEEAKKVLEGGENSTELDEIERYLEAIQAGTVNKQMRMKLRARLFELTKEENLLRKQLKLSIPVTGSMRQSLYQCQEKQEKQEDGTGSNALGNKEVKSNYNIKIANPAASQRHVTQRILTNDSIENESDEDDDNKDDEDGKVSNMSQSSCKVSNDMEEADCSESKKFKLSPAEEDGDIAWIPPPGQTGDGRTLLNDKYGY